MSENLATSPYFWVPGIGPSAQALQRLRALVRLPRRAMGEAWFMSEERRLFSGLMDEDPLRWRQDELDSALFELSSGPGSFGARREWLVWFGFLLPRAQTLIGDGKAPCFSGRWLHGALATATFVHCPDPGFPNLPLHVRRDLLDTLARTLFAAQHWNHGRVAPNPFFQPLGNSPHHGFYFDGGDALAASCLLVLKYLDAELIDGWLVSALGISDPNWRAAFVVWLAGSAPLIVDAAYPGRLSHSDQYPATWQHDHLIHAPTSPSTSDSAEISFIDPQRRHAFLSALRRQLDRSRLRRWQQELTASSDLLHGFDYARRQYETAAELVIERYGLS
ncbi:hypothetical protein [Lysobacter capsici]|uniref:hypothetical protein n=1 Tax=Lysobacter capsici TaxID=435897 RepID=UPI001C003158|nr:hypothetical protein [Lysobacter capsici]QWF18801.1 hypothetical protein KME82_08695 [Lysobacter capsici]